MEEKVLLALCDAFGSVTYDQRDKFILQLQRMGGHVLFGGPIELSYARHAVNSLEDLAGSSLQKLVTDESNES